MITKAHLGKRKAIREAMAQDYYNLHGVGGYSAVGAFWDISGGMAWSIIKDPDYWPVDKKIRRALMEKANQFNL